MGTNSWWCGCRYDAFVNAGIAGMRATKMTHRWKSTLIDLSNVRSEQNRLLSQVT